MIKAICFDFNGVIIDDEPLQLIAYQEALSQQGIELTENDYYGALGMNDEMLVRASFERAKKNLTDEVRASVSAAKVARHRQLMEAELPLFPGVVTFLKAAARSYPLALVSMATKDEIAYVLDRAQLRSLFSAIVSTEDVNLCKPAPDCYLIALEKLNERRRGERQRLLSANECLVIEDSPPGIQSGRQAGMRTLGVTNTVSEEQLRAAGAEVVTASLADWTLDAVHHVFD
jgi:phosphoglycolate phosphatase/beta-phosphoglucomutase